MVKLLHILWLVLVQPRKIGKHSNMTEKLLTGMLSIITNTRTNKWPVLSTYEACSETIETHAF